MTSPLPDARAPGSPKLLILAAALMTQTSLAQAADVPATSRIEAVTVYPAGAEITRSARVRLEAGDHAIVLPDLPEQTIANSIRVEGRSGGRLEIGSVDARRAFLLSQDTAVRQSARKRLEDQIEQLGDQRTALDAQIKAAEAQNAFLENLGKLPTTPSLPGAGGAREDWGQIFSVIGTRSAEVARAVAETQIKQREIDKQINDLRKQLAELDMPARQRTEVRVNVLAGAPLEATLTIRYQVPNAQWSSFYDARLSTGDRAQAPRLTVQRRAAISNQTGEDWTEVAFQLSTTRPGRATAPPELFGQTIDFEQPLPPPRPLAAPAGGATRQMAPMMSDDAARAKVAASAPPAEAAPAPATEAVAQVTAGSFQAVFDIAGKSTIKSGPEQKRTLVDQVDIEPQLLVRTVPINDATAYLSAKITVPRTSAPWLQGPVGLFRDNVFVGQGRIPQLAPGEEHDLGFGADDRIKVTRAVRDDKKGETGTFTTSRVEDRSFAITVRSLHSRPIAVHVIDRIPVSLQSDIKVEPTFRVQPTKRDMQDRRGTVQWELTLAPDENREIGFGFRVTYPGDKRVQYR
jgi:uncharacterized protein (TIGR02231 family)